MGGQSQDLGYRLVPESMTFQVGQPLKIQIKNPASYRGLLMYVQGANDEKIRNGNFEIPAGFKSNRPNCDADLTVGPNGVITHSSADPKPGDAIFTWTPDRCEDSVVRAVVVGGAKDFWQVLPDVKITCASTSSPATDVYETNTYGGADAESQTPCNCTTSSGTDTYSNTDYATPVPAPAPTVADTTYNDSVPSGAETYDATASVPAPGVIPAPAPVATQTPCNDTVPAGAETYSTTTMLLQSQLQSQLRLRLHVMILYHQVPKPTVPPTMLLQSQLHPSSSPSCD
ncbi:hypothetical protein BDF19DRAFT_143228 [Syncephalis fuscata]|nr:hypothetical protein BDF19DRAFT_143228 [Syncephalis fuscata]